jgi:hypothetical protein
MLSKRMATFLLLPRVSFPKRQKSSRFTQQGTKVLCGKDIERVPVDQQPPQCLRALRIGSSSREICHHKTTAPVLGTLFCAGHSQSSQGSGNK